MILHVFYWLSGEALAKAILDVLEKLQIPIANCIGQAYDGASNMSGNVSGTAAIIKQANPRAVYTHCKAHVLNLSLMKGCKNVQAISKFS